MPEQIIAFFCHLSSRVFEQEQLLPASSYCTGNRSSKGDLSEAMVSIQWLLSCLGLVASSGVLSSAFVSQPRAFRGTVVDSKRNRLDRLYDMSEWRDQVFDFPGTGDDQRLGMEEGAPLKEVCILPFPYEEVLLQGETKQLRLYEERCVCFMLEVFVSFSYLISDCLWLRNYIVFC